MQLEEKNLFLQIQQQDKVLSEIMSEYLYQEADLNNQSNVIDCNQRIIKGVSLFANVGISEAYFKNQNIEIVCANELLEERAKFYQHLYPSTKMICGDITNNEIFNQIVQEYKQNDCEFLIATPPCQGMSVAGKMDRINFYYVFF